jgi:hypothetical protein
VYYTYKCLYTSKCNHVIALPQHAIYNLLHLGNLHTVSLHREASYGCCSTQGVHCKLQLTSMLCVASSDPGDASRSKQTVRKMLSTYCYSMHVYIRVHTTYTRHSRITRLQCESIYCRACCDCNAVIASAVADNDVSDASSHGRHVVLQHTSL